MALDRGHGIPSRRTVRTVRTYQHTKGRELPQFPRAEPAIARRAGPTHNDDAGEPRRHPQSAGMREEIIGSAGRVATGDARAVKQRCGRPVGRSAEWRLRRRS